MRLKAQYFVHDLAALGIRDVGRIADQKIAGARSQGDGAQIRPQCVQARGGSQPGGVGAGHFQGRSAEFQQQAAPARAFQAEGHADAARASAQVRKAQRLSGGQQFQSRLHQQFRFRTGDQGVRGDQKSAAEKFPVAENMGQGFARGPAGREGFQGPGLVGRQLAFRSQDAVQTVQTQHMPGQQLRAKAGAVHPRLCQSPCGVLFILPQAHAYASAGRSARPRRPVAATAGRAGLFLRGAGGVFSVRPCFSPPPRLP